MDIGLVGLGVMGENLALNLERNGFSVSGFDLDAGKRQRFGERTRALREVVALGALHGVAVPSFMSALCYYDAYRSTRLPANLLQAQRDCFGAHTYQRVDRPGKFHSRWGT